jgi:hypothetical protein
MGKAARKIRSDLANEIRKNPESIEVIELRREFAAVRLEEQIRHVVDQAPPLTPEQRIKLAGLFVGGAL